MGLYFEGDKRSHFAFDGDLVADQCHSRNARSCALFVSKREKSWQTKVLKADMYQSTTTSIQRRTRYKQQGWKLELANYENYGCLCELNRCDELVFDLYAPSRAEASHNRTSHSAIECIRMTETHESNSFVAAKGRC